MAPVMRYRLTQRPSAVGSSGARFSCRCFWRGEFRTAGPAFRGRLRVGCREAMVLGCLFLNQFGFGWHVVLDFYLIFSHFMAIFTL